jgi:hypothetical protein
LGYLVVWFTAFSEGLRWLRSAVRGRVRFSDRRIRGGTIPVSSWSRNALILAALLAITRYPFASGQTLIRPSAPSEPVTLLPSDLAILESPTIRKDLPCIVTPRKTELGFDLRFHSGYDVLVPLSELEGEDDMLTLIFRVYSQGDKDHPAYFSQHIRVPQIDPDAKGDAALQGSFEVGEGNYHVDWLMRDRSERPCSGSWDTEASLPAKDHDITLFIGPKQIQEDQFEPFRDDPLNRATKSDQDPLNVKLLVNFAPQTRDAAALPPVDLAALVTILKTIEHDSRVGKVSLVAFNMQEHRVLFRQESADQINFPALGSALQSMKLGTVTVQNLGEKHGDTDFLSSLIEKEIASPSHPDAVIFAGPKTVMDADVPQDDLRRIGEVECPVFYMNYNPNPQAVPWKDSIGHAVRFFRGTEFTISRPRDLWLATSEMLARIVKSKRSHEETAVALSGRR